MQWTRNRSVSAITWGLEWGRESRNWHLGSVSSFHPNSFPHQWVSKNITSLKTKWILTSTRAVSVRHRGNNGKEKTMHPTEFKPDKSESPHSLAPTIPVQDNSGSAFSFFIPWDWSFSALASLSKLSPKVQTSCSSFPTSPSPRAELPWSSPTPQEIYIYIFLIICFVLRVPSKYPLLPILTPTQSHHLSWIN